MRKIHYCCCYCCYANKQSPLCKRSPNFAILSPIRPKFSSVVVFDMLSSNLVVTCTKPLLFLLLLCKQTRISLSYNSNFAILSRIRPKFWSVVVLDMLSSNLQVTCTKHYCCYVNKQSLYVNNALISTF